MLLTYIQPQLARSGNLESADFLHPDNCYVAFRATTAAKCKAALTVLLALLMCCANNRTIAQVAGPREVADKNSTPPSSQKAPLQNVRELKLGQVVEGELKSGEIHRYSVALKAGEYMKVATQSSRFHFAMEAIDPGGYAT